MLGLDVRREGDPVGEELAQDPPRGPDLGRRCAGARRSVRLDSRQIPLAHHRKALAEQGALFSYGPDFMAVGQDVAGYVDRIVRGARPADLPVQQATRLELVINLKTAKALGLTIPQTLLLQADQVIQ